MDEKIIIYFPNGCTICAGEVFLHKETFEYKCESCDAWADCHRENSKYANKYEPTEYLANKNTHFLRNKVRTEFSKLYLTRMDIMGEKNIINTAIINIIFTQHIVLVSDSEDEEYAFVLATRGNTFEVALEDNGKMATVNISDTTNITNRDKALIWLAKSLGLTTSKCNIGTLSDAELKIAHEHIYEATLLATRKSIESM